MVKHVFLASAKDTDSIRNMRESQTKKDIHIHIDELNRSALFGLGNISLNASSGDLVLLKGYNGSGKTSFLKCAANLLNFKGKNDLIAHESHWISAQSPLQDTLSVTDNLTYLCLLSDMPFVVNGLKGFEADTLLSQPIKNLSEGQKQRVYLSTLLMQYRPVWLLDEPTKSLDKAGCALLKKYVETHRRNGGIAIIASHDDVFWAPSITLEFGEGI